MKKTLINILAAIVIALGSSMLFAPITPVNTAIAETTCCTADNGWLVHWERSKQLFFPVL